MALGIPAHLGGGDAVHSLWIASIQLPILITLVM
jgi:hypothetical protein